MFFYLLQFHILEVRRVHIVTVKRPKLRKSLTNKSLKRKIASLSALGAGALVAGAGTAEASIIYSGPINVHVGYSPGGTGAYFSPYLGTGSAAFTFFRTSTGPFSAPGSARA